MQETERTVNIGEPCKMPGLTTRVRRYWEIADLLGQLKQRSPVNKEVSHPKRCQERLSFFSQLHDGVMIQMVVIMVRADDPFD